jgi:hypothetical protein
VIPTDTFRGVSDGGAVFDIPGVDALYAADLSGFTRQRDDLVKQLKKDGDKDGAAAVKQLRKPTTVAWAVNQVARRGPDAIDELLTAARDAHAAQARAVQDKDGAGLREATTEWRARIRALAADVARDAGEQYRDEAAATFEAASTSEELAAVLKAGRLVGALSPSGFGLQGMPEPPSAAERPAVEPKEEVDAPDDAAVAAARAHLEELDTAFEKATHRLRRADQRLDVARQDVDDANLVRADAQAARDKAAASLQQLLD